MAATPGAYISLILAGSLTKAVFRDNHDLEINIGCCVLSSLNDLTSIACSKQMMYQFQLTWYTLDKSPTADFLKSSQSAFVLNCTGAVYINGKYQMLTTYIQGISNQSRNYTLTKAI